MDNESRTPGREDIAAHFILFLIAILALREAAKLDSSEIFWQPLLINVGSGLFVVTVVFSVFKYFLPGSPDAREKKRREREAMAYIASMQANAANTEDHQDIQDRLRNLEDPNN